MKFTVKRFVTLPLLKLKPGVPAYVRFKEAMRLGKKVDDKKEAATVAHILDLSSGQEMEIICPLLLQSNLRENYKDDSYVNKDFEIILTKVPEKKYNLVSLTEIAVDDADIPKFDPKATAMQAVDPKESNVTAREAATKSTAKKK